MKYFFVELLEGYNNVVKVIGGSPMLGGAQEAGEKHAKLAYGTDRIVWKTDQPTGDQFGTIKNNTDGRYYRIRQDYPLFD